MTEASKTMALRTQAFELTKSHTVYDGNSRVTEVYTGPTAMANGAPCTLTSYQYSTPTGPLISGMKETMSVWDSSWDF